MLLKSLLNPLIITLEIAPNSRFRMDLLRNSSVDNSRKRRQKRRLWQELSGLP